MRILAVCRAHHGITSTTENKNIHSNDVKVKRILKSFRQLWTSLGFKKNEALAISSSPRWWCFQLAPQTAPSEASMAHIYVHSISLIIRICSICNDPSATCILTLVFSCQLFLFSRWNSCPNLTWFFKESEAGLGWAELLSISIHNKE